MKKTMKNLMMLILALVMVLSLCACGSNDTHTRNDDDDDDTHDTVFTPGYNGTAAENESLVPTAEEQAVLDQYCAAVYTLQASQNPEEIDSCYRQLLAMDASIIEKFAGTEFAPAKYMGYNICWDYNAVMDAITVIKNVKLSQKETHTDFIGDVTEDYTVISWFYDENGQISKAYNDIYGFEVIETNPANFTGDRSYTYDENGRVSQIRYTDGRIKYLVEVSYDENGNKTLEHATDAYGDSFDIIYTYDEEKRLTKIDCGTPNPVTYLYIYDDNGLLIQSQCITFSGKIVETMDYTYDANGHASSAVLTFERNSESRKEDQYTFTCDDEGRITHVEIIPGDEYYVAFLPGEVRYEAIYAAQNIDILYGNYCVFNLT